MIGTGPDRVKLAIFAVITFTACADPVAPPRGHPDAEEAARLQGVFFPDSASLLTPPEQAWNEIVIDTVTLSVSEENILFEGALVSVRFYNSEGEEVNQKNLFLWSSYDDVRSRFRATVLVSTPTVEPGAASRPTAVVSFEDGASATEGFNFLRFSSVNWTQAVGCLPYLLFACTKRVGSSQVTLELEMITTLEDSVVGTFIVPESSFRLPVTVLQYGAFADSVKLM